MSSQSISPDPDLGRLLPHRPPMLLLDRLVTVASSHSESEITISSASAFYTEGQGVPAWIGIEYMGQTAATIAGYQLQAGTLEPHVGLLLGTRKYHCEDEWFRPGETFRVRCTELNAMQGTVATFQCEIARIAQRNEPGQVVASANLTVYRAAGEQS